MLICHFINGLAFTKKVVNTCGNGVMKECGGTVDVLLSLFFLFYLSLTAMYSWAGHLPSISLVSKM